MSDLRGQLDQVRRDYGRLTPEFVLDAARPEEHPLHSRFEWNDTVAAEKWRREQAADLIRSYRVTYAKDENGPKTVRGFLVIRPENDPGKSEYRPVEEVMADPLMQRIVLRDLERELASLKSKYGHLKEYHQVLRQAASAA